MALLPSGVWVNPNRSFWVQDDNSFSVKELKGISSINGAAYSGNVAAPSLPSELSTLTVAGLTISSINGAAYPPLQEAPAPEKASGPTIQSGSIEYQGMSTEIQLETAYSSTMQIFLQPSAGMGGMPPDGIFYPTTSNLNAFTINSTGYSYSNIVYWMTVGY